MYAFFYSILSSLIFYICIIYLFILKIVSKFCFKDKYKKKDGVVKRITITPKLIFAGILNSFYLLFWYSGLLSCGPLNTIMLETSDIALIGLIGGCLGINPSGCIYIYLFIVMSDKVKGSIILMVGYVLLGFSGSVTEDASEFALDPEDLDVYYLILIEFKIR